MLVFLRVYACVYVPYMAMHALRVAVGIGGLRLESIFERVAHQPALAGGMCALHTKFVRILTKISNTLLHDYSTVSVTPPPSQEFLTLCFFSDPVQTPISLDKGLYKHVHLFRLTFSANVGHYMALIEAYRGLDRVNTGTGSLYK